MSVRTLTRVWESSAQGGTNLLMLLAIADFADDDGQAFPSVPKLAKKCRTTSRHANRILASLRDSGELQVRVNAGPGGANRYRITLVAQSRTPDVRVTPDAGVTLTHTSSTPDAHVTTPLTPTSDEPSFNRQEPSEERARKKGVASNKTKRPAKTLLPKAFGISERVKAWAASNKVGDLDRHLEHFVGKAEANGYAYVNWDSAFINAIREDWARVRALKTSAPVGRPTSEDERPSWAREAGFPSVYEAESSGCGPGNHRQFSNGQRITA